ncbi:DUF3794 and LysM peptidoglycan-binding domain-containing protein [Clostridium weizhouense]|uniref:DUF3794 domain-containing protein n=1 Tax=Clostridium weizhouense TaxID=2859781 RepID=A0ABS7AJS8_9CLOT|nr:SPOCS domain-containing protein [Clostridium weizhouense]MBW6408920.1 DUF3794 domain-containing protein [Clostridium weizhouense]
MSQIDAIKESIGFEQLIRESNSNCVLKEEYLIPDTHPDVQEILTVEAKPIIKTKELVGDKMVLDGKVEYTVLYLAREDGFVVNSVNYTEKFTSNIDLNQEEHKVICEVECKVEHIDATIMNERKISIQAVFGIDWEIYKSSEVEFVKDIEGTDDIEVLKKTETINRISASEDLDLLGKSTIRVGMDKPQINKILKCSLSLHKKEIKILEDKVYLSCYCKLNILYKGDDSRDVIYIEDDVYLSKEEEIKGVNADMMYSVSYEISSNDLMLEEDDLGEVRVINNEFVVKANLKVFSKENIDIIKDAYCPKFPIELRKDEYELGVIQGTNISETIVKDNLQLKEDNLIPEQIISSNASVIIADKQVETDKVIVDGILKVDVLYKTNDSDKYVENVKSEIPFTAIIEAPGAKEGMKAIVRNNLENIDAYIEANTIAIKATLMLSAKICYEMKKEFISDVVEKEGEAPQQKASVTIYVVGQDDTLWKLAKKYNTTVESLVKINNIEEYDEIEPGKKIIIPGRAIF